MVDSSQKPTGGRRKSFSSGRYGWVLDPFYRGVLVTNESLYAKAIRAITTGDQATNNRRNGTAIVDFRKKDAVDSWWMEVQDSIIFDDVGCDIFLRRIWYKNSYVGLSTYSILRFFRGSSKGKLQYLM